MIEFRCFPVVKIMAGCTICNAIFFELPVVLVAVACDTTRLQTDELLMFFSIGPFHKMTGPAGCLLVCPGKRKIRFRMIKIYFTPPAYIVTFVAGSIGIILFTYKGCMNIFMAIGTATPDISE